MLTERSEASVSEETDHTSNVFHESSVSQFRCSMVKHCKKKNDKGMRKVCVFFFLYPGLTLVISSDSHRNSEAIMDAFNTLGVELNLTTELRASHRCHHCHHHQSLRSASDPRPGTWWKGLSSTTSNLLEGFSGYLPFHSTPPSYSLSFKNVLSIALSRQKYSMNLNNMTRALLNLRKRMGS